MNRLASCFLYLVDRLCGRESRRLVVNPKKMTLNELATLVEKGVDPPPFDAHSKARLPLRLEDARVYSQIASLPLFLSGKMGY
jgi:hypothetical protein